MLFEDLTENLSSFSELHDALTMRVAHVDI